MLLYGATGHARVIIDCLESNQIPINGIFDDDISKKELLEYKVIGNYNPALFKDEELIISIGENEIRKKISEHVSHKFGKVVHKSATISKYSQISEGTVVFHKSIIQNSVIIGRHVIINTSASIDHDCIIEDFAHISPNATLCGGVKVGEGTQIGAGSVVIQNINIGKWCTIGAGAVVIKDIPDYSVVVGNPGRKIKTRIINE